MQENRERWMQLAELAANEQDPKKLVALVEEINRLLEQKQKQPNAIHQEHHESKDSK